jgi:nucleotide-binding universal stress UspA family protein
MLTGITQQLMLSAQHLSKGADDMRRQINRILCATDFSRFSQDVVNYGIRLAKEFHATLYICHIVDVPTVSVYGEAVIGPIEHQNRFMEYARQEIETLVGDETLDYKPLITLGIATDEITRLAKENIVDLVIAATHGRSGLKRFFLGSVTERLMRTLPCPLLVLRGSDDEKIPEKLKKFPFKKILVGCDFSEDSHQAFEYSLSMAQEFESELHLVHVVEPSGYKDLFKLPADAGDKFKQELYDMLKDKLISMVPQEALPWMTPKTSVVVGKPYEELVRYAELNDIDLITLGIRGYGMVEELLVGSNTDRVVRRSPCAVLSVSAK